MSTHSTISKVNSDGKLTRIYCHNSGYPAYNGAILLEVYNTEKKLDQLLSLGGLSSIDHDGTATAYHRDEGEDLEITTINPPILDTATEPTDETHNYVFKDGKWYYYYCEKKYSEKVPLTVRHVNRGKKRHVIKVDPDGLPF